MEHPLSADQGMGALLEAPVTLVEETLPLQEAFGRVLARTVTAQIPSPPFARSPYDGYALRSADTAAAAPEHPVRLGLLGELAAGAAPSLAVEPGRAVKVLTGAPVPAGADAVVKYEDVRFGADWVEFSAPCPPGNIVPMGEDVAAGAVLAQAGEPITGPVMGVLAGQGLETVRVWRRPRVSVVSTGSELTPPGRPLAPGHIYSTNLYPLGGLLRGMGAQVEDGGIVPDDPQAVAGQLLRELGRSDLVVVTGGASVGDYDYTRRALDQLGAKLLFCRLAFKPGGAMMAGLVSGKVVLGLSGNPGAAAVGLLRVGAPYVHKLCGRSQVEYPQMWVRLKEPLKKASPQTRLVRGRLEVEEGQALFVQNPGQYNGAVSSLLHCDLLAQIPAGSPPLSAGTLVRAYRVGNP